MAEEAEVKAEPEAKPKRKLEAQLILGLLNTILVFAAMGLFIYTKLLFERPVIVEEVEMKKKKEEIKTPPKPSEKVIVPFKKMMLNIAMTSGKAHYATVEYSLELKDQETGDALNHRKDLVLDKIIASFGKRQLTELNTIQGKLLLKTELLRSFNSILGPGSVTDIYFSEFLLQ